MPGGSKKFLPTTGATGKQRFLGAGAYELLAQTSMTQRLSKNFVQKKLALVFRSLVYSQGRRGTSDKSQEGLE